MSFTVSARAFDGLDWSAWTDVTVNAIAVPADHAGLFDAPRVVSLTPGDPAQVFNDFVGTADFADIYRFDVAAPGTLNMNLSGLESGSAVRFLMGYDADGGVLTSPPPPEAPGWPNQFTNVSGSAPFSFAGPVQSGTYYLRILSQTDSTPYSLSLGSS